MEISWNFVSLKKWEPLAKIIRRSSIQESDWKSQGKSHKIQEYIPVVCIPTARNRTVAWGGEGGLPDRDSPGQRSPWIETPRQRCPWTETLPPDKDPPGQRPPIDRYPSPTHPRHGQRPPWTGLKTLPCRNFVAGGN